MSGFFISYRRGDSRPWAASLYRALANRAGEEPVFRDLDSIAIAEDFRAVVRRELDAAHVVLVLIGPKWLDARSAEGLGIDDPRDLLRQEIATALSVEEVVVLPVLVGRETMPLADDLPTELRELTRLNALVLPGTDVPPAVVEELVALARSVDPRTRAAAAERRRRRDRANTTVRAVEPEIDACPELAITVLLAALDMHVHTTELECVLRRALLRARHVASIPGPDWLTPEDDVPVVFNTIDVNADGSLIVTGDHGTHFRENLSTRMPVFEPPRYCALRFWRVRDGRELWQKLFREPKREPGGPRPPADRIEAVAFSPAGDTIAVATGMGLRCFDANTGEEVGDFSHRASDVEYSGDGTRVIAAVEDNAVVFDSMTYERLATLSAEERVTAISISSDGHLAAVRGERNTAIWNVDSGSVVHSWSRSVPVAFGPDDTLFLGSYEPARVERLRYAGGDPFTLETLDETPLPRHPVDLRVSRAGQVHVILTNEEPLVWHVGTAGEPEPLRTAGQQCWQSALAGDGSVLATLDGPINVWRTGADEPFRHVVYPLSRARSAFAVHDGSLVVFAENRAAFRVGPGYEVVEPIKSWDQSYSVRAVTPDGSHICLDNPARVMVLETGEQVEIGGSLPLGCAFSADGKVLAAAGYTFLEVFDTRTGERRDPFGRHEDDEGDHYWTVALSPDGSLLATGSMAGRRSHLWNVASGERLWPLGAKEVVFTPDGRHVLAELWGSLRLVSVGTGEVVCELTKGGPELSKIAVANDGTRALTLDEGTARLWTLPEGKMLHRVGGGNQWIVDALFAADGTPVTIALDGSIQIWDDPSIDELRRRARNVVVRELTDGEREKYGVRPG